MKTQPKVVCEHKIDDFEIGLPLVKVDFSIEFPLGEDQSALTALRQAYKDLEAQILLTSTVG